MVSNLGGNQIKLKEKLPLLHIRDIVVYPFMILPLFVGRESSIKAVEDCVNNHDRLIVLAAQKEVSTELPGPSEIHNVGTVAMIMRMRNLPDGRIKVLVQGVKKVRILQYEELQPFYLVKIDALEEPVSEKENPELKPIIIKVKEKLEKLIHISKSLSPDVLMILEDIEDAGRLADLIASNLNLKVKDAQIILETLDPLQRLKYIDEVLTREISGFTSQKRMFEDFKDLGTKSPFGHGHVVEEEDEFEEIAKKITAKNLPENTFREVTKQLGRLKKMHPESSESNIIRGYIDWVLDIPWSEKKEENHDLVQAQNILDEDHYELHQIKDRIIEHLAVMKLKSGKTRGPILCFSGPPGVGKTSLGKSIAKSLGRDFVRISLGGVKDESEIRGHRRTYVGAMPGKFIQAMKQAGSTNPVILLDEIDKMGSDNKGDPSSALLEVLDPEQNNTFKDHFLNLEYDLSDVMFIATANYLENISPPLRDRMEIIQLSGYSEEEKVEISKKYMVQKQQGLNGIDEFNVDFTDQAILKLVKGYTREAGLRVLEQKIAAVCRKLAKKVALGESIDSMEVNSKVVEALLGPTIFQQEDSTRFDEVGVASGLAWTSVGGEILQIEASMMKGHGMTLTGKLGEVMKESAQTAFGFIRSNAALFQINPELFSKNEFHIHLPAGAVPKDGPSAGITLATTLVSLLTNTKISKDIAMTGEITLKGKVLPVGGIKEKCLAAMRHGIETIIIPWKNQKDLLEIPKHYRDKVHFIPVKNIHEVLEVALVDWDKHLKSSDTSEEFDKLRSAA